ncbi:reverse transcriptase domain-containing protein [Tanacetum coccineum]
MEVPIKINIHAWKVRLDCLPTRLNLSSRGLDIPSILCPSCGVIVETTSHVFFQCELAKDLFRMVCNWWNVAFREVYSFDDWVLWYQEPKFLIKMPQRRNRNINDVYEQEFKQRIMARMEERLNQFVDQLVDRMNDMMNPKRRGIVTVGEAKAKSPKTRDEKEEYPFVEKCQEEKNNVSFPGVVLGVKEESLPVYDTDIEDVIEEEEGFVGKRGFGGEQDNIEDVVVVANDLCFSMIQTTLSVDFSKTVDSNPHELIWLQKGNLVEVSILIGKKY